MTALRDVSLQLEAGQMCAVLGQNGAGKTTLLEVLSTVLLPSDGHASILGHDVVTEAAAVRRHIAFAPAGGSAFFPRLTGRQNLEYFAALHNIPRRDWRPRGEAAAEVFDVAAALDRRVDTYSDGMRQRLALARAYMSHSRVWVLDEPTRGLDPGARAQTQRALREYSRAQGATMVVSTHDLAEAETICDRVIVLHQGRVTLDADTAALRDTPGALAAAYGEATA